MISQTINSGGDSYIAQRTQAINHALQTSASHIFSQGHGTLVGRDSQDALSFLTAQLAYTENRVFEKLYTPMQYEQFLPISFEGGEYATEICYDVFDFAGQGKPTTGRDGSMNRIDVAYSQKRFPVCYGSVAYSYTVEELRQTAFLKKPISDKKMSMAMEAYRRHMNVVGLFGEEETGLTGLYNNLDIFSNVAPNGKWDDIATTAEQILEDIDFLIEYVWNNTQYNDVIDTIIMAPTAYSVIARKQVSVNSDMSILNYLRTNNIAYAYHGHEITVLPGFGLNTLGQDGTARMIGYVKSDQRLVMHMPMPLRFLAPQVVGLSVNIPGEYKYSGVEFRYPQSASYMDNILTSS